MSESKETVNIARNNKTPSEPNITINISVNTDSNLTKRPTADSKRNKSSKNKPYSGFESSIDRSNESATIYDL